MMKNASIILLSIVGFTFIAFNTFTLKLSGQTLENIEISSLWNFILGFFFIGYAGYLKQQKNKK